MRWRGFLLTLFCYTHALLFVSFSVANPALGALSSTPKRGIHARRSHETTSIPKRRLPRTEDGVVVVDGIGHVLRSTSLSRRQGAPQDLLMIRERRIKGLIEELEIAEKNIGDWCVTILLLRCGDQVFLTVQHTGSRRLDPMENGQIAR